MKQLLSVILLSLVLLSLSVAAEDKPEKVFSIVKQLKPYEWYEKQANLWKKEIDRKPSSPLAWLYFYTANRMAGIVDNEKWSKSGKSYFYGLDSIVSDMKKAIPNTFEYYYIQAYNNNSFSEDKDVNLLKAYETDPSRPEDYDEFISQYELKRNLAKRKEFCEKMYNSNEISPGVYQWNYNVLAGLEKNAILFTGGDNDTYPAWILQDVKNYRPDVLVLNVSLLCIDSYREKIFSELKIKPWVFDTVKFKTAKNKNTAYSGQILSHILDNYSAGPLYFSLTLYPEYYEDYKKDAYLTGLAFKYSKEKFDNIALLRKNFENNFLLDYLRESFSNDISESVVKQINMNYIPAFLKLYEHYELAGDKGKANKIKEVVTIIATDNGKESDVKEWFNKP